MAEEDTSYEEFISQILRPTNYTSLKDPAEAVNVQVLVFANGQQQEIQIESLYPFNTIAELSALIYIQSGERQEFHPENQCLLMPTRQPDLFTHFQYIFNKKYILLDSPFKLTTTRTTNPQFVDLTGNSKLMEITSLADMTLESTLFTEKKETYTLHLYLYRDLYESYTGMKPINRTDWEGIFRVYFPQKDKANEDGSLSDVAESYKNTLVKRVSCRQQMIELIDAHAQETPLRKPGESSRGDSVNLSSIKNLRFFWKKPSQNPSYKSFDIETAFYDTQVSPDIPYMRFFKKSSAPISKIHVEGALNIPSIQVPELLFQWAQMKSITPDENLIMAKVLLRSGSGSVNPLYATFFIHEDGSAKFIIQPDANTKALTKQGDLFALADVLRKLSAQLPKLYPVNPASGLPTKLIYSPSTIGLEDAYIVLSLWLEKDDMNPITKKSINMVLPFYRPFFQVSSTPLEFQNPIAYLRYKRVDNFQTPSRDFQFLHRVIDLQKLSGATNIPQLVKYYMDEFDVAEVVAQARVSSFLSDLTKYEMVDPVTTDYKQAVNPGIDVAIFGKHPYYTFHIYRINSVNTLRRIKTLISLLISLEASEFEEIRRCYMTAQEEESEQQQEANQAALEDAEEAVEEDSGETAISQLAANAVTSQVEEEGAYAFNTLGDFAGFGEEEVAVDAPPLQTLAAQDDMPASEAKAAASAAPAQAAEAEDDEDGDITSAEQLKHTKAKTYFSKRLDFYDRRLFQYAKGDTSIKKYSSQCQSSLKQPIVMSEDEYARMKDMYENNTEAGDLVWIEYPLKRGQPIPTASKTSTEVITTLRYGSNLLEGQANVFICCKYWCRKDEIVVLKSDFLSTKDRKGRPKDKETCPFCRGGLVKDYKTVVKGETVIERMAKGKSVDKKAHLYVGFLGKGSTTEHPEGLFLPCCYLKDPEIYEDKHPAFAPLRRRAEQLVPGVPVEETRPADESVQYAVDYKKKLGNNKIWYIVGAEKMPLEVLREGPQIGILPLSADKFFSQESKSLVINDHTVWKLLSRGGFPSVSGFLRIAVENRKRYLPESFLAAIAPFYGVNSAAAMKQRMIEKILPRLFLSLNYGNFMFDYFDPSMAEPTDTILRMFSRKWLGIDIGVGIQKESVLRAWKSYEGFKQFMDNTNKVKEFRQFAHFLSLPNLLTWDAGPGSATDKEILANGIMFVVLEVSNAGTLEVRCPPYGVSRATAERCDVAFLLHYPTGAWEPVIYTDNDATEQTTDTYMIFRRDAQAGWPQIIKKRVREYENMCFSSGLGIYTDSAQINPETLLPLSVGMSISSDIFAILRDTYNHVAGILFFASAERDGLVLLPVIDDGTVYPEVKVELDWRHLMKSLATAQTAANFYATKVAEALKGQSSKITSSYTVQTTIRLDKSIPERADMYALHLSNGLFVPVRKMEAGDSVLESDFFEEGQELPWVIDTKLVFGSKEADLKLDVDLKEFEEIYQHLRFTFANWYAIQPPTIKSEINGILYKDGRPNYELPLFEKRQRMFIKLGNEIMSWLDSSIPQRDRRASLKRVDCRIINDEGRCSNRCVWKAEADACLLHVPSQYEVGLKQVDAKGVLIKKLIEELIRFPQKRAELLGKKVSQYVKLTRAFRAENQYIVPEDSVDWSELLRMEWTKNTIEQPRYAEEFGSVQPRAFAAEDADAPEDEAGEEEERSKILELAEMPEVLRTYIKKPALLEKYKYYKIDSVLSVLEFLGLPSAELEARGQVADAPLLLTQSLLNYASIRLKLSIAQLIYGEDMPMDPELMVSVALHEDNTRAHFLFFTQLDDGSVGLLSLSDTEIECIPYSMMPYAIQKGVFKTKFIHRV